MFVQSSLAVLPGRICGVNVRLPDADAAQAGRRGRLGPRDQRGQASAEYALVLLGAAAVALLVTAWATRTNRVGRLLDAVMDQLLSRVS